MAIGRQCVELAEDPSDDVFVISGWQPVSGIGRKSGLPVLTTAKKQESFKSSA
jgi:hypothetical protein